VTDVAIQNANSDRCEILRLASLFAESTLLKWLRILGGKSPVINVDAKYENRLADLTEDCLVGTEINSKRCLSA